MDVLSPEFGFLTLPGSRVEVESLQFGGRVLGAKEPLSHCFVLVPGNPGVIGFYETFLARLQAARPSIGVLGVGFTGHSAQARNGARRFDLADQIAHRVELLDHLRTLHPGVRFTLAGHSIGAYICLEVLRQASDRLAIDQAFLLFPTVRDLAEQAGLYKVLVAPGVREVLAGLAGVVGRAPESWKRALVRAVGPAAGDCPGVIESLFARTLVANSLHLGASEFRQVRELDADTIARHLDKLVFHYGVNDPWVPPEHRHDIASRFPSHPHVRVDRHGAGHAFCLEHSAVVADAVLERLAAGAPGLRTAGPEMYVAQQS